MYDEYFTILPYCCEMFHKHLLLESKLLQGRNHGLFLPHFSTQYSSSIVRNSLPGSPWMDEHHRTCQLPEILKKKINFARVIFETDPSFSLDSQGVQRLSG